MFPGVHFCCGIFRKKMLAMFLRKEQILLVGANTVLLDSTKLFHAAPSPDNFRAVLGCMYVIYDLFVHLRN